MMSLLKTVLKSGFSGYQLLSGCGVRWRTGNSRLHPGSHSRAYLAARLWPDVPDASARASLRTAIWSVRQAWGPAAGQVLDGSRSSIGLPGDQLWVAS
jgi:hypothetical protein